eukprot:CAMPEP_0180027762 /NCGR_PEP_ID=MMETSP0984-20121128/25922_1 /TAXON_ID=483367 /ORGANISM="non described non described, Strain CCMP 2436" /LENGTH=115 /DNA_ID=CAMNT_0021952603 /DNA_START=603 /DNA_END=951 /DNA_ORIENTATION=+
MPNLAAATSFSDATYASQLMVATLASRAPWRSIDALSISSRWTRLAVSARSLRPDRRAEVSLDSTLGSEAGAIYADSIHALDRSSKGSTLRLDPSELRLKLEVGIRDELGQLAAD